MKPRVYKPQKNLVLRKCTLQTRIVGPSPPVGGGCTHLRYAKATKLANTQLNPQAEKMNAMISPNVKALRSSQLDTAKAIAKIQSIRGNAEGFAESMLHKAADGEAPDLGTTWAAFSGVLTSETIDSADWGTTKKKAPGSYSNNVFDITETVGKEPSSPPTPMQHVVHQFTDAKVHGQPALQDHEAPDPVEPQPVQWATGSGKRASASATTAATRTPRTTPRTRTRTTATRARARYRTEKSVSRELWPLEVPYLCALQPPRCRPHCLVHPKRAE